MSVCLVTGGSRGIGAACCKLAARDGFDIAINYRSRADEAEKVADAVRAQGRKAIILQGDTTAPETIKALFDETERQLGPVTGFVSNSGIIHEAAPLWELDYDLIRQVVDTDLTAHLWACGEAVRRMSTKRGGKGGSIVVMSSAASKLAGAGGFVPYGAAKAGTDILTLGLAREAAAEGIRVNALRPGLIETEIHNDTGDRERLKKLAPGVPMGRTGSAEEVAETAVWLLSDKSSYVTAAIIDVTGGR